MNKIYTTLAALAMPLLSIASTQWTLQGTTYTVDTIAHAKVGPGTTYTAVRATGGSNLNIFYSVTDLTNPNVELRAVMANDKIASTATVPSMATAHNAEGALHFAGVNADFFSGTSPVGTTVANSEVYYASNNGWTHWAFDESGKPHLGSMTVGGSVTNAAGTSSFTITGINRTREADNLIIYTPRYGTTTGTNSYGCEVLLTPTDGALALGKTLKMKVTGAPATAGSMAIPAGCYVLSGHGTGSSFVSSLTEGEEITVNATLTLNGSSIVATQVLGGQPMILSGGEVLNTESALDHLVAVNPRTAVGHNADGTKVVMLVVDGRSATSDGCVSKVLADIMREVGCTEAMNYDGGGSSTFYVDALGTMNSPSGGTLRAVTNGMFAVATSPTDNEIASIAFADYKMTLPRYGYYTPVIYGYNKYGVLIDANVQGYTLSCVSELGEVVNDGASLFANGTGYHALTATYGSATTSIPVTIGASAPSFRLDNVLVDSYTDYVVEVTADINGNAMPLDNQALTWVSADESIATVDATGKIHGVKNGTTTVYGSVSEFADTLTVVVEIPTTRYKALDPNIDISTWKLAKSGMSSSPAATLTACGTEGLTFDFTISSARSPYIGASKEIVMWSLPDSLQIVINPGESAISKISFQITPGIGGRTVWRENEVSLTPSVNNTLLFATSSLVDATDMASFPITFKAVRLYPGGTTGVAQHIEISQINTVYANIAADDSGVEAITGDNHAATLQLTPNPVAQGEDVAINVDEEARYAVYAINGVLMTQGAGNIISTDRLTSGVYIVKVESMTGVQAARLIVK